MTSHLKDLSAEVSALAAAAAPAIVAVQSKGSSSAGFAWKPGLIVTASDALAEEGEIRVVLAGGDEVAARLLGRDPSTDIALLGIERQDLPPAPLSQAVPSVGSLTLSLGREGEAITAALGVVSLVGGPWRSMRGGDIDARIELDARLRRRSEGALVIDPAGAGLGMAVFGPRRRVLVIPAATIERVAARLQTHGRIAHGYLGLGLHPVTIDGSGGNGALVMSVDPKGPGAAAGIHQGDVIVAWEGKPITRLQALVRSLGPDSVGRTVAFELRRGGQAQSGSLTIAERPAD